MRLRTRAEPEPSPADGRVVAVDRALRLATARALLTHDEALGLLHAVRDSVTGDGAGPRAAEILAEAESSLRDCVLVDPGRVVDPLLDVRLVLAC
jgi:hypothetical protein